MRTSKTRAWTAILFVALLGSMPAIGDDLSGADRLLCSSVQATVCSIDADCEVGPPWDWNIPQFIQIDLEKKTLGTTPASGEQRVTPVTNLVREDGVIVLQGFENGRAFSFVIHESSGQASVAVARDGVTVSVFAACTPQQ